MHYLFKLVCDLTIPQCLGNKVGSWWGKSSPWFGGRSEVIMNEFSGRAVTCDCDANIKSSFVGILTTHESRILYQSMQSSTWSNGKPQPINSQLRR